MRALVFSLAALSVCSVARADTFVISYEGRAQVDPEAGFTTDCLGATEADDCAVRAALLETELVEGLGALEGLSDDATKTLFTNAIDSDSDGVKQLGLRYYARGRELPTTLWARVKEFFLGPEALLGQPAAEILGSSSDATDQALSDRYDKLRPASLYGANVPESKGEQDEWAAACARESRLEEVPSFAEDEQFAPASRLLMVDRFLNDYQTGMLTIPGSGFVTDAPRADVVAFFDKLFGKPASPPIGESEAKLQALNAELTSLQSKLASGDQAAIRRAVMISEELGALTSAVTVAGALLVDEEECADCVFWLDGEPEDVFTKSFTRAVIVGTQPQLKRTTISYLGSGGKGGATPTDGGTPMQDGGIAARPDAGTTVEEPTTTKSDGGCATHAGSGGAWLVALALLLRRRRHGQFM